MEKWIPIKGYEGFYEISNCGRIKSLTRRVKCKSNKTKLNHGKILKNILSSNGYYCVNLMKYGIRKLSFVHVLMAENFIGEKPSKNYHVMHLDDNKTNNKISNLSYGMPLDNSRLACQNGKISRGVYRPNAILDEDKVRQIRKMATERIPYNNIMMKFNIKNKTTISAVVNRQNWAWVD